MTGWAADARYVQLVEEHSAALMRLAMLLSRNRHDAEDAVQEALISVAQAWPRVRPATALAYARKAVVHEVIDQQRRRREVVTDMMPEQAVEDLGLIRHEDDRAFVERVRHLPSQQRAVLVLRYYADLPDAEIGRLLHCSAQTVRSQASRALAKLRAEQDSLSREAQR